VGRQDEDETTTVLQMASARKNSTMAVSSALGTAPPASGACSLFIFLTSSGSGITSLAYGRGEEIQYVWGESVSVVDLYNMNHMGQDVYFRVDFCLTCGEVKKTTYISHSVKTSYSIKLKNM